METILVPLDGSLVAEQVLSTVRQLASTLNARVHLLRVITDPEAEQARAEASVAQTMSHLITTGSDQEQLSQRFLTEQAAAYLASHLSEFCRSAIPIDYEVLRGDPAATIVAVATHIQATLIAMGTHGYGGLRRWALGSVSDQVVRSATSPVLLVHNAAHLSQSAHSLNRVLVPVDGLEASLQLLPLAQKLAQQANGQVVLITAVHPDCPPLAWLGLQQDASESERLSAATAKLDAIAATLRRECVSVRTIVETGNPGEVISQAAQQHADLVVMAAHYADKLHQQGARSPADILLHTTTLPLLLVPTKPSTSTHTSTAAHRGSRVFGRWRRRHDTPDPAEVCVPSSAKPSAT